jgi:ankyrin repeat protein
MTPAESPVFSRLRTSNGAEFFQDSTLDLAVRGTNGQTLLHEAIAHRKTAIAIELIGRGADVNAVNKKGETPLHYAATYRNLEVAQALLARRADVNIVDKFGNGPLWVAMQAEKGDYKIAAALVENGADAARKNNAGRSVLDFATLTKDAAMLQLLRV